MKKRIAALLLAMAVAFTSVDISAFAMEEAELSISVEVEGETYASETEATNDELFTGYVESLLYGENVSVWSVRNKLTCNNLAVYNALKEKVTLTANGELASTCYVLTLEELGLEQTAWTAEELGMDSLLECIDGTYYISDEAVDAMVEKVGIDISLIMDVLLAACPYELYWYDKTIGVRGPSYSIGYSSENGGQLGIGSDVTCYFAVSSDYSAGSYTVDTEKIQTVKNAIVNVQEIVSNYKNASDYDKLVGYREEICDLVSYNYDAAYGNASYGDPWQIINVFDQDADTKVVCEGYAKAFQYLCDLSAFNNKSINCISVTGIMYGGTGAGGHMWNIVTMNDGRNYLVDVTNCDTGTIGAEDQLFLAGCASGDVTNGYTYQCTGGSLQYVYSSDALSIYEKSELDMADAAYVEFEGCSHRWDSGKVTEPTCEEGGFTVYTCELCGESYEADLTEATGHKEVTDAAVKENCEESGLTEGSHCSVCEKILVAQEEIPASGHNVVVDKVVEATCTKAGLTEGSHCSVCDKVLKEQETVEALGHSYGSYKTTKKATFGKKGVQTATCTHSGCTSKKTRSISAVKIPTLSSTSFIFNNEVKTPVVVVKDSSGKKLDKVTQSSKNGFKVTYASGRKVVGKYAVKVTLTGANYTGIKTVYFTINPKSVAISKLTKAKKEITVKWAKPTAVYRKQMTGYQICYSTSSTMKNAKTVYVKNATATSKTIKNLKKNKKYYVQIRTYKKIGTKYYYSSWCSVKNVKTK